MTCVKPVQIFVGSQPYGKQWLNVPCGKCVACRISRSREWSTRLMHELDDHTDAVFLTLTFNEENLPDDNGLCKRTLQLFLKRLRKALGKRKIRYFAVGEYGENFGRPHYHAIVFGLGFEDKKLVESVWTYGFVHFGTVTTDSCRYVTDYIFTAYNGQKQEQIYGARTPPFRLLSNGLGLGYVHRNLDQLRLNLGVTIKGIPVGLPRYYRDKASIDPDTYHQFCEQRALERAELLNKFLVSEREVRAQRAKNIVAKVGKTRKGTL